MDKVHTLGQYDVHYLYWSELRKIIAKYFKIDQDLTLYRADLLLWVSLSIIANGFSDITWWEESEWVIKSLEKRYTEITAQNLPYIVEYLVIKEIIPKGCYHIYVDR